MRRFTAFSVAFFRKQKVRTCAEFIQGKHLPLSNNSATGHKKRMQLTCILTNRFKRVTYFRFSIVAPNIALSNIRTIKIKKMVFAMEAAPEAMLVNPKMAATMAINRKMAVHLSIV
jgi:hypothetical protein